MPRLRGGRSTRDAAAMAWGERWGEVVTEMDGAAAAAAADGMGEEAFAEEAMEEKSGEGKDQSCSVLMAGALWRSEGFVW